MKARTQPPPRRPKVPPGIAAELEDMRVIERPDGFWVQPLAGGPESGPYRSLVDAIEGHRAAEEDFESPESLAEMEAEVGVADWIDPETCAPAEDGVPHLEEH